MDVVSVSKPYQDHHAAEDKESTRFQHPIPNLHALLIGIDTYASVANLTGASKDADSVENFLRSDLSVPSTQITNLRNEQATRSGFLAAFDGLRRNPNIVPLDPILIYYAGHGCEVDTPSTDWGNYDEKTQCLVPWDVGTKDAAGNPIPPIPDYTIAALLYALAAEKGDNITVIFDCCHAASSTRGITHPGSKAKLPKWKIGYHSIPNSKMIAYRARRLDPKDLPRLTGETDVEILRKHARMYAHPKVVQPDSQRMRTSYDQPPSGPRRFGRSHILLAACAHAEIAYECTTSDRGYFTAALLQRLRSSRIHKLTYKTCFEDFPQLITPRQVSDIGLQSPVCEGDAGRLFFSSAVPKGYRDFVPIQQLAEGYTIKVGIAQGVIPGSVYGIYEDDAFGGESQSDNELSLDQNPPPCGTFTANPCSEQKLYPCQSCCDLHEHATIPSRARAKLLLRGHSHRFEVFLTDAFKDKLSVGSTLGTEQGIIQVDSPGRSKVVLDFDEKEGRMTVSLTGFADALLYRCDLDWTRVQCVLFSMAQWDWHLYRGPLADAKSKKQWVQLQMYRLDKAGPIPVPLENGVATLTASSKDFYGFRLKSLFNRRLYVYLFYFSALSQSIKPLFLSVYSSGYVDAPLEANGELTIGYESDDMISGPLSFRPAPDVGYFKLFLTTSPGDFDSMIQPSPFVEPESRQTMFLQGGDEYSDGIEIKIPGFADQDQVANPTLPTNLPDRLYSAGHRVDAEMTNSEVDDDIIPVSDTAVPHRQGSNIMFFSGRSRIGLPPRVLSDSEASGRFDKQDIWDTVSLKVVLKIANY